MELMQCWRKVNTRYVLVSVPVDEVEQCWERAGPHTMKQKDVGHGVEPSQVAQSPLQQSKDSRSILYFGLHIEGAHYSSADLQI